MRSVQVERLVVTVRGPVPLARRHLFILHVHRVFVRNLLNPLKVLCKHCMVGGLDFRNLCPEVSSRLYNSDFAWGAGRVLGRDGSFVAASIRKVEAAEIFVNDSWGRIMNFIIVCDQNASRRLFVAGEVWLLVFYLEGDRGGWVRVLQLLRRNNSRWLVFNCLYLFFHFWKFRCSLLEIKRLFL